MTRIRMGLLLGLLLLVVGVAGCGGDDKPGGVASLGGSGQPTTTNANASEGNDLRQALAFARCMRQHGLPNFPDPQLSGDAITQDLPGHAAKGQLDDRKVKAAEQACRQYQPNGGQPQRPNPQQQQQQVLAFARCMRQHGINLPDPQFNGNEIVKQDLRGLRWDDPRVTAAEQACRQRAEGGK